MINIRKPPQGGLAQLQKPKMQPTIPPRLELGGMDQSLARSGNMLRKGISRMRQMNKGGKVKLAEGGKVKSLSRLFRVAFTRLDPEGYDTEGSMVIRAPDAKQAKKHLRTTEKVRTHEVEEIPSYSKKLKRDFDYDIEDEGT